MTDPAPFLLVAGMDVDPDREDLFNEVYDREHVPSLTQVPGVSSIARYERGELTMSIGGEVRRIESAAPRYYAVYGLRGPEVLTGDAWARPVELGRWPSEVRPFTRNRQHILLRRLPSQRA